VKDESRQLDVGPRAVDLVLPKRLRCDRDGLDVVEEGIGCCVRFKSGRDIKFGPRASFQVVRQVPAAILQVLTGV